MSLKTIKFAAFASTVLLSIVGIGAISAPAYAADCEFPVEDQTANDKPKNNIRLISPVLTDDNSIRRYDFESNWTNDCDWFGVGMRFNQAYVPFGLKTNLVFQATTPTGVPLANTRVTLRANKGYSKSNAAVRVNGIKARPAPSNASDGANVSATTDVNGIVNFVVQSPDDCEAYGGVLPDAPANPGADTPNDKNEDPTTDCFSQFLPSITGEKTDSADFLELHYHDPNVATGGDTTSATGNGTVATITTTTAHNLSFGSRVVVSGVTPDGYNGTYTVTNVPTAKSFSYASDATGPQTGKGIVKAFPDYTPSDASISILAPTLRVTDSEAGKTNAVEVDGGVATYSVVGSKQIIAFQALKDDLSYARNTPVTVRINLANSGANAKVSAGLFANSGLAIPTPADATKTAQDQLVLSGTTDAFGVVAFTLNNTDTTAAAAPATPTSPPAAGSKYARVFAEITGKANTGSQLEFHYYKPVPPTSIAIAASGRKITVTLTNAKAKKSTVAITGLKTATVTPTVDKKAYAYTVKKGKITVKVVSNGKTLTKVFTIK